MTWSKAVRVGLGVVLALLGSLWVLQGADVVRIAPVGCVAECRPITGGSPGWLAIGVLTLLVGLGVSGLGLLGLGVLRLGVRLGVRLGGHRLRVLGRRPR